MSESSRYVPPKLWQWNTEGLSPTLAKINRPISGSTHRKELPIGKHPLQLYSAPTPNGQKVAILLEELLAIGIGEAEYDAWLINFIEGEQFGSGFVDINPNSKIPALVDYSTNPPTRLFESGAILLYLAEKFGAFIPENAQQRADSLSWLFWQMASAPLLGGGFGHFYAYAPEKLEYPINRYTMEIKRQLDVLDKRLADNRYLCGEQYCIADIATYPWYGAVVLGKLYGAQEFLDVGSYRNVLRWVDEIEIRPAVIRGLKVNTVESISGKDAVPERHSASDLD